MILLKGQNLDFYDILATLFKKRRQFYNVRFAGGAVGLQRRKSQTEISQTETI